MIDVALQPEEVEAIEAAARMRQDKDRRVVPNSRIDRRQSAFQIERDGIAAEYVVAEYLGLSMVWDALEFGDGGRGDVYGYGLSIAVKASRAPAPRLLMPRRMLDDIAVLCRIVSDDKVLLVGWVDRQTFADLSEWVDLGYGPTESMPGDRLSPLWSLRQYVRRRQEASQTGERHPHPLNTCPVEVAA